MIDRAVTDSIPASRDEGKAPEGLAVRNAQVTCQDPSSAAGVLSHGLHDAAVH